MVATKFQKYCRTNGGRTAVQMGGVLQYKWEAYCRVHLSSKLRSRNVQRYKWGAYCRTNWRCTAVLIRPVVGVGVSETLPICSFGMPFARNSGRAEGDKSKETNRAQVQISEDSTFPAGEPPTPVLLFKIEIHSERSSGGVAEERPGKFGETLGHPVRRFPMEPFLETLWGPLVPISAYYQGGKRNPNPNLLVRIFSSGVGVFHVNGWGPKSSIRPSKPGKSSFWGGISRDFAGILPAGAPEKFEKKKFVFNFRSLSEDLRRFADYQQICSSQTRSF